MKAIVADSSLVARCGLYCGACRAYLRERCPGCRENLKAGWCRIRACCREHAYVTCADCHDHSDPRTCRKFHNLMSQIFALLFRSDRAACVRRIRESGIEAYATEMARMGRHAIKR